MSKGKVRAYVFDIDGTLSLVGDRVGELHRDPPNWDAFYERCGEDEPHAGIVELFKDLRETDAEIVLLTGRRESVRKHTTKWLRKQGIFADDYRALLMRPDGNVKHDTIVKPALLKDAGVEPIVIFEDRDQMVTHWRGLGFCCCQVAKGDF